MRTLTRLFFILPLLLLCPCVYARQAATQSEQEQAAIAQFADELLTNIARASGEQDAQVKRLAAAREETEKDLKRIIAAREKASGESSRAEQYAAVMKSRIRSHGGAQSIYVDAYEDYERSVQAAAAARAILTELTKQEEVTRKNLEAARSAEERARRERDAKNATREAQREELGRLLRAWHENRTEENFKALTGHLTTMAAGANETSDVDLATKDSNNNPTQGAVIKYESELDRKNKAVPVKSANCVTGCIEKGMPKGWYYMWSERNQQATSDTNRYVHIRGPKDTVEISETP